MVNDRDRRLASELHEFFMRVANKSDDARRRFWMEHLPIILSCVREGAVTTVCTGEDPKIAMVEQGPHYQFVRSISGFNLGDGVQAFDGDRFELLISKDGDWLKTGRLGRVISILQDGEADVVMDDGQPPYMVKWRQILKIPAQKE